MCDGLPAAPIVTWPESGKMHRTGRYRLAGGKILIGLSLFLFVAGCAYLPLKEGGDASLFSRLAARSWTATEPPRTFGPNNLYEEIDGEAELFLPYGFRELTVGFLRPAGNKKAEVRLEIFRQATPRDAFGVFSQQRFPDQDVADVGAAEAIVSGTSLDFFQGPRFVRIRAALRNTGRGDLERLGRDVSALLPGTGDPPPETEALRVPGFVDRSLVFHQRAILGYEVLAPGYEAKYAIPGTSATLVLITPEDAGPAAQFRERLSRSLPGYAPIEKDLVRADLPSGTLWLMSRNGFYFGVAGKLGKERALPILHEMEERGNRFQ
jgi:hypothetical protein